MAECAWDDDSHDKVAGRRAVALLVGAGLWTHVVSAAELTDMNMPVMDGRATIIAIRAINPKVKVVGSSGMSSVGGFAEAKQIGADRFVAKPYTAQSLLSVLREVIENAR